MTFDDRERFGFVNTPYAPKWEQDVERCPDKLASSSKLLTVDEGQSAVCYMEIKGAFGDPIGVLVLRGTLPDSSGVAEYSNHDLLFLNDFELRLQEREREDSARRDRLRREESDPYREGSDIHRESGGDRDLRAVTPRTGHRHRVRKGKTPVEGVGG